MDPDPTTNFATPSEIISTSGEVFDDGTALELIADQSQNGRLSLLHWSREKTTISNVILHRGKAWMPIRPNASVACALKLPCEVASRVSTSELFGDLVTEVARFTGIAETSCQQLAACVFASWLPELFPEPLSVALWSPAQAQGAQLIRLLKCVCRRSLALIDTNGRDVGALTDGLHPTLLIFRPAASRRTQESLAALGWRGFFAPRSGRLVQCIGAKIFCSTGKPLDVRAFGPMIEIPIAPSRRPLPILDGLAEVEITRKFQPALLLYRLMRLTAPRAEGSKEVAPRGSNGPLATGFNACFDDEPALRNAQVALLLESQQNGDADDLADPNRLVVEVLLARCHQAGQKKLYALEIALDIESLTALTGKPLDLSAKMVGGLLKSVGLRTRRLGGKGRGVLLNEETRRRIHEVARSYGLASGKRGFSGCNECSSRQATKS